MFFAPLLALGLGQLALAQNISNPIVSPSTTAAPNNTTPIFSNGFPARVGQYQFYGCVGSEANFPTFEKIGTNPGMSLDLCAASCPSRFFGVSGTDCWCGKDIDSATTTRVPNSLCSVACPGNDSQFCGGVSGLTRRQVPNSIFLTVYIRVEGPEVVSTTTTTINGVPTTITTTYTTSVIATPVPTPEPYWPGKVIICYGDYCVPQGPCGSGYCQRQRVVCQDEQCWPEDCHDDQWNKLVECKGDKCKYPQCKGEECHKKVVCYDGKCAKEKCFGDECKKKLVCKGEECGHKPCKGDECYRKEVCHGDSCKPAPPCKDNCPTPKPPVTPPPCKGDCKTPPPPPCKGDCKTPPPPPCSGPKCPPPPPPPCYGPNCPPVTTAPPKTTATTPGGGKTTPAPPCAGPNCPPCSGPSCPTPIPGPKTPIVAGSEKVLPALGLGAIAGLAFFL